MKKESKMRTGILIGIGLLLISALLLGACAKAPTPATPAPGTPAPAPVEVIKLKFAQPGVYSDMASSNLREDWWMGEIEKRSGGRVKFEKYYGGVLGGYYEMLKLIQGGGVQTGILVPTHFEQFFPYDTPLNSIYFLVRLPEEALRINHILYDELPFMHEAYRKQNVVFLLSGQGGPYYINTTKPMKTLEEMKGKKFYTWGTYAPKLIKAAGAVPVSVNIPDVYDALDKGLLDGRFSSYEANIPSKHYEVAKYWTMGDIGSIMAIPILMNLDTYNSLPADIRKIVDQVSREGIEKEVEFILQRRDANRKFLESKGSTFFDFPAADLKQWRDATGPLVYDWVKELEGKGLGANAKKVADRIVELAAPGWAKAGK